MVYDRRLQMMIRKQSREVVNYYVIDGSRPPSDQLQLARSGTEAKVSRVQSD
jgi:hypothetical protein